MRGISEEALKDRQEVSRRIKDYVRSTLIDELISECKELNPWRPIGENTPTDKELFLYYPEMFRSNKKIIGYAFERNVSPMHGQPTHYQELPDDPKE